MTKTIAVASLLIDIEAELRQLNLWQTIKPSSTALSSQQPFCVDTLDFNQWLQFIFLQRMHDLVEQQQLLPDRSSIAPMAEEALKGLVGADSLISVLLKLDQLLTR